MLPLGGIWRHTKTCQYSNSQSTLRRVDVQSGQVLQRYNVDSEYFAEGLTYYEPRSGQGRLLQLTWKAGVVFLYDAKKFTLLEQRSVVNATTNGEGWGICHVASEDIFYVSDGTQYLHKWNESTLQLIDKVEVTYQEANSALRTQNRLTELEYDIHSGTVLANVWYANYIVRIDPSTGFITHRYDLTMLYRGIGGDVLNGMIAITDIPNEIWVTGKDWAYMYLIRLID